jgi:N-acetylated-alpha-linked acidic dipeptidase
VALTRIWGLVALRLANADVLPYDFGFNAIGLEYFLTELEIKNKIDTHKLKLKKLHERIGDFQRAGEELREAVQRGLASGRDSAEKMERLNQQLLQVESNWLDPNGIPGRPWFQHLIYASRYTYAHLEFPGLTEAAEKGDWKLAAEQAELIERAVAKNIGLLRKAKTSWEKNN